MMNNLETVDTHILTKEEFRTKILKAQEDMKNLPNVFEGKALDELCPLEHSFGDGIYVRKIFMPKGTLIISKIHKFLHPYFVLTGKASVLTEKGIELIEAPYHGMTLPGTKRALFIHEDMIWITVHVTDKTDLKEIEKEIIAKDFDEFDYFLDKDTIETITLKTKEV